MGKMSERLYEQNGNNILSGNTNKYLHAFIVFNRRQIPVIEKLNFNLKI